MRNLGNIPTLTVSHIDDNLENNDNIPLKRQESVKKRL